MDEQLVGKIVEVCVIIAIDRIQLDADAEQRKLADHKADKRDLMLYVIERFKDIVPEGIKKGMRNVFLLKELEQFYEAPNPFWGSWNGICCVDRR